MLFEKLVHYWVNTFELQIGITYAIHVFTTEKITLWISWNPY